MGKGVDDEVLKVGGSKFRLYEQRSSTCEKGMSRAEQLRATRSAAEDAESRRSTTDDRHTSARFLFVSSESLMHQYLSVCILSVFVPRQRCPDVLSRQSFLLR